MRCKIPEMKTKRVQFEYLGENLTENLREVNFFLFYKIFLQIGL